MKIRAFLVSILALGTPLPAGGPRPALALERAPGFTLPARDGGRVALDSFKGKQTVVLFFQEGPG